MSDKINDILDRIRQEHFLKKNCIIKACEEMEMEMDLHDPLCKAQRFISVAEHCFKFVTKTPYREHCDFPKWWAHDFDIDDSNFCKVLAWTSDNIENFAIGDYGWGDGYGSATSEYPFQGFFFATEEDRTLFCLQWKGRMFSFNKRA